MPYVMTDSDAALLRRLAGGLNFNYRNDPALDADGRFAARVLPANMIALNDLVGRLDAPSVPPGIPPAAELIRLPDWQPGEIDDTTGRANQRRVRCADGRLYGVAFAVPAAGPTGYRDAYPMVRPSIAVSPSGAWPTRMSLAYDDGTPIARVDVNAGAGAAMATIAPEDLAAVIGRRLIVAFGIRGTTSDVLLDIVVPTPKS